VARHPALAVNLLDPDLVLACVDDFSPAAAEQHEHGFRVFFPSAAQRDLAAATVRSTYPSARVVSLEVDDEDWARRSQADLKPVCVGSVTLYPSQDPASFKPDAQVPGPQRSIAIVIQPSMGFGTGHHATTRLCLAALQAFELRGRAMLDVGTGSGVLAIAGRLLGAERVVGIDCDPDAVQAARENLALNPQADGVTFEVADLKSSPLPGAHVVTANLTGATLIGAAKTLSCAVAPGGVLIVSGLLADEEAAVRSAFTPAQIVWRKEEDGWIAMAVNVATRQTV